jgi:hypothetical protein
MIPQDTDLGFLSKYFTSPSLGPFSGLFDSWVTTIIGLVWFGSILYAAVMLIICISRFADSKKNYNGYAMSDAISDMIRPAVALIALSLVVTLILIFGKSS